MTSAVPLGEISSFITKGATPTTYGFAWQSAGVAFLRSECVSDRGLDMRQSMFISQEANHALRRSQVVDGDILMTITGNVGRVVRLDGVGSANINQHIARIRVKDPRFDPGYVFHYLAQQTTREYFESIVTGQAYPQISLVQVRDALVPKLPRSEQQSIARALDDADDLIQSLGRLIAKKQAIKQGIMQQLLAGRTRLSGFSGPWNMRRIGDFTEVKAGGTPSTSISQYWDGDVRWMSSGEVHQKRIAEVKGRITVEGLRNSAAQMLPKDSVLMALAGQGKTRGTVAISRIPLSTNQSIAGILPSTAHDSEFLYYNLDTRYAELRGESTGDGGRGGLNLSIIKNLYVYMPELDEQRAIADILRTTDDELDVIQLRRQKAIAVKQGMMQQLLTGRTRLRVEASS